MDNEIKRKPTPNGGLPTEVFQCNLEPLRRSKPGCLFREGQLKRGHSPQKWATQCHGLESRINKKEKAAGHQDSSPSVSWMDVMWPHTPAAMASPRWTVTSDSDYNKPFPPIFIDHLGFLHNLFHSIHFPVLSGPPPNPWHRHHHPPQNKKKDRKKYQVYFGCPYFHWSIVRLPVASPL